MGGLLGPRSPLSTLLLLAALLTPTLASPPQALLGPAGPLLLGPFEGQAAVPSEGKERVLVDPYSGSLYLHFQEIALASAGPEMALERVWRSDPQGGAGAWVWSYQDHLEFDGLRVVRHHLGQAQVMDPDSSTKRSRLETGQLASWQAGASFGEGALVLEREAWVLHLDGQERRYDGQGQLLSIQGRAGLVELKRDALSRPTELVCGEAHLKLFFDGEQRLSVALGGGHEIYVEHRDGHLLGVSGRDRARTRFFYDTGRLVGVLWADGSRLRVSYDEQGRVAQISGPGSFSERYRWSERGLTVSGALGQSWRLELSARERKVTGPMGHSVTVLLDDQGRRSGWIDPKGQRTLLSRDPSGRLVKVQAPGARTWRLGWDPVGLASLTGPTQSTWRVRRDSHGQVVALLPPSGPERRFERSPQGWVSAMSHGGVPLRVGRDSKGQVEALRWPNASVTRLRWDEAGSLQAIVDPGGSEIVITQRQGGRVREFVGRAGARWLLERDSMGRLRQLTEPSGRRWRLDRDASGRLRTLLRDGEKVMQLAWRASGGLGAITDALGGTWGLLHDSAGRTTGLIEPDGNTTPLRWDPSGVLVELGEQEVKRDPSGLPLSDGRYSWRWNTAGQLTAVSGPDVDLKLSRSPAGEVSDLVYGGLRVSLARDGAGAVTGLRSEGQAPSQTQRLSLTRDAMGQLIGVSGGGAEIRMERDDRGLVVVSHAGESTRRTLYDKQGLWVRQSAQGSGEKGQSFSVARHPDGSPKMLRFPDGSIVRVERSSDSWTQVVESPSGAIMLDHRESLDALGRRSKLEQTGPDGHHSTSTHHSPRGEVVAVEQQDQAWFWAPDSVSNDQGALLLDEHGQVLSNPRAGHGLDQASYVRDSAGCIASLRGERSLELSTDGLGRLSEIDGPLGHWQVEWGLLGELAAIQGPEQRWELSWVMGRLVAVQTEGRSVQILGDTQMGWVWLDREQIVGLVVDSQGTPQLALPTGERLSWSPLGQAIGPIPLGPQGSWRVYPEGFLLDGQGAWDPYSGVRLCSLAPPASPQLSWTPAWPWDPKPWLELSPFAKPLELLAALGELEPLLEGAWTAAIKAGALPYLPTATGAPSPALAPGPGSLPLRLSPLEQLMLRATTPPVSALDPQEIRALLITSEYTDQAVFSSPAGVRIPDPISTQ